MNASNRSRVLSRRAGLVGALATAAALGGAVAAPAAPPAPPHLLLVAPTDDVVVLEEYDPAAGPVTVDVFRGALRIATSGPTAVPSNGVLSGILELNQSVDAPALPDCWSGHTPDLSPGDRVTVTQGGTVEETTVQNLTVGIPGDGGGKTVTVTGTARDPQGGRLPIEELAVGLRAPRNAFSGLVGTNTIEAPGVDVGPGGSVLATIAYDDPDNPADAGWTATFAFSSGELGDLGLAADASVGWFRGAEATEVVLAPEGPKPGVSRCTLPSSRYAALVTTPAVVSDETPELAVRGTAPAGATGVQVTLSDADAATTDAIAPGTLTQPAPGGGQTWHANFTSRQIEGLRNGLLTATPSFTPAADTTPLVRPVLKTEDGLAPATITDGPAEGSVAATTAATFAFASPAPGATFACRLDDAVYAPCVSPVVLTGLAPGPHTFAVRAVSDGAPGAAATRSWNVGAAAPPSARTVPDTRAPRVRATLGPASRLAIARTGALVVPAECDEDCRLVARVRVVVPGARRGGPARVFHLTSRPVAGRANATAGPRVRLAAAQLRLVRAALHDGRRVQVVVTVTGRDGAGNAGSASPAVTLTRRNL